MLLKSMALYAVLQTSICSFGISFPQAQVSKGVVGLLSAQFFWSYKDSNFQGDCSKETVSGFSRIKNHLESRIKHSQTDSEEKCPNAEINRCRVNMVELESLDDVADLVEFSKQAETNTKIVSWTVNDAMRIIRPFIGLAPRDWPTESERLQLLLSLEVPESTAPKELLDFMSGPLEEYEAKWMFPVDGCLSRAHITISLNDIFPAIKPLAEKESCAWTAEEVEM